MKQNGTDIYIYIYIYIYIFFFFFFEVQNVSNVKESNSCPQMPGNQVFVFITIAVNVVCIPNRTFLVRFGGISGEFGRAMVRILARRSRAKIPMARPNEPDIPPKRTKKIRLGIYRNQIQPKILALPQQNQVSDLIS